MGSLRDFHEFGLVFQGGITCFSKLTLGPKKATEQLSAASPLEKRLGRNRRPGGRNFERRAAFCLKEWRTETGDPKRRAQVIQVILDLFGTVECLGACERAICCMLP